MYKNLKTLKKYRILTSDGIRKKIYDFYFDEQKWIIRYIVVNASGWIIKNLVLISTVYINDLIDSEKLIKINLTNQQVVNSPDIDSEKPVSRQKKIRSSLYQGFINYWTGFNTRELVPVPVGFKSPENLNPNNIKNDEKNCLRSMNEVIGYYIQTEDGKLGYMKDIIINRKNWSIKYFIFNTRNLLPGKDIKFSIRWIKQISWEEKRVYLKCV